jgi:hypothetical protein
VSYQVQEIVSLRRKMEAALSKTYVGSTPRGDAFNIFVDDVTAQLPKTVVRQYVYDSLRHLAGERITAPLLLNNLWRLAGNVNRLRRKAVPPWNHQSFAEWVPAAIVAACKRRNGAGKIGYLYSFQILGGLACPMIVTKFWTNKFCHYFSRHLGYAKRRFRATAAVPKNIFRHPREFVTMRLQILIEPRLCTFNEPGFDKVKVGSAQLKWNHEQMAFRDRLTDEYGCPFEYPASRHCYLCHVGFKRCRAGCHARDYEPYFCNDCGRSDALFDPELGSDVCIECYDRRQVQRET